MSTPSLSQRLRQKIYTDKNLQELSILIGRPVHSDELGSLEQVNSMQEAARNRGRRAPRSFEIPFSDLCSDRFRGFVRRLYDANPSSIYVWTPHTIDCGALLVRSIAIVRFDFEFTINLDGILSFSTSDAEDDLLLDFSVSPMGEQIMQVETTGVHWGKVAY